MDFPRSGQEHDRCRIQRLNRIHSLYYLSLHSIYIFIICFIFLAPLSEAQEQYEQDISATFKIRDSVYFEISKTITLHSEKVKESVNIRHKEDLSLDEAFAGKNVDLKIRRKVSKAGNSNKSSCEAKTCEYCRGRKKISTERTHKRKGLDVVQSVTMPCPVCYGSGVLIVGNCESVEVEEKIPVRFPAGSYTGFNLFLKGKGHEIYDKGDLLVGNLMISTNVLTEENIRIKNGTVEIGIEMSPEEALEGLFREIPYIEGHALRIDRKKRLTLPGTEIVIPNFGFPCPSNTSSTISGASLAQSENRTREDLIVRFELQPEGEDDDDSEEEDEGKGNTINIRSQSEVDALLSKKNSRRQNKVMRNLLLLLKQQKEKQNTA